MKIWRLNTFRLFMGGLLFATACDDAEARVDVDAQVSDAGPDVELTDASNADGSSDLGDTSTADMPHPYADSLFLSDKFLNIAHRGGGRLAPEETLPAYQNAISLGVDVIECDLHATSDGVVVCMHDSSVSRTTDGVGAIRGMTLAEVKALDAGYHFTTDGGLTYPYRAQGVEVPTLDELLAAFPDAYVALEIKQDDPPIIDELSVTLDRHDAAKRVMVAAFSDATLNAFRTARPDIITAFALGEMLAFTRLTEATETTYVPPGLVIQAPIEQTTAVYVDRAQRLGLKLQVWTINDRTDMEEMIDLGVDGIFTDDPALLNDVLGR